MLLTAHAGPSTSFALPASEEIITRAKAFKLDSTPQFQRVLQASLADQERKAKHAAYRQAEMTTAES